ncbi:hypothetical protein BBJ29_009742 [Phytophthora kernoviae]|uniref:Hexose transporter 1 n=1 Tax=Phytophthora kernoviae TaxID=325452 RepID=A0A3F2RC11_9STRA|nr:hypothetical protein BBP00_00009662 [Phytophthora kernoviae]RLN66611.1 hypothetical protein BBJ29_009742 [Phytophthora kernoviae]
MVVAAAICGAIAGAALSGVGNHVFGRRRVILLSSIFFMFGSALMAVAETFNHLLFGRLIVGLGIGCASTTVPLYIAEASPPHIRGRLVSLNSALVTGGQFFASVLDALLADTDGGWRYMLGLAAFPAAVQFVGFVFLPESPRYLVSKGKQEEARTVLMEIRGTQDVETELEHIKAEVQSAKHHDTNIWSDMRSPPVIRALTLGCSLQCLQQLCGINTVMYYGATIIQMAGFTDPTTAIWLSALVSFSNFIFTFVGIYLVDRAGRRLLTLGSLAGVFLSLVALGGSFYVAEMQSVEVTVSSSLGFCSDAEWKYDSCPNGTHNAGWAILLAMFVYLAFFASGMGCMPWTINAEIYPLHVRSFSLSISTSVNWVSNLLVSFTFLSTIDALAPYGAFWMYATIALFGFVYLWNELPETKGLELEEIQQIFADRIAYSAVNGKVEASDESEQIHQATPPS